MRWHHHPWPMEAPVEMKQVEPLQATWSPSTVLPRTRPTHHDHHKANHTLLPSVMLAGGGGGGMSGTQV